MRVTKVNDPGYVYPAQAVYLPPDSPMFKELDNDPRYVAEPKKNGWRCMVRVKPTGAIELWTRRATVINDVLPNLRAQLAGYKLRPDTILDGELMGYRGEIKEQLILWGCIKLAGRWLSALSYREAHGILTGMVQNEANVSLAIQAFENKVRFYNRVMAGEFGGGNEGIVLKNLEAPVPFGWKGEAVHRQWFKVKPQVLADGTML